MVLTMVKLLMYHLKIMDILTGDKIYYESYVYSDDIGETVESKFSEIETGVYFM